MFGDVKRTACFSLSRILEERREVFKKDPQVLKKDEAALFQIANDFDIRHSNQRQLASYSEEFLDWIFWIFLASTELSGQLLKRRADGGCLTRDTATR